VEAHAITSPVTPAFRDSLRPVKAIDGLAAPFTLGANASYRAVNEALAAKASVTVNGDDVAVSGIDRGRLDAILKENRLKASGTIDGGKALKAARVGLYRPWVASMDEGWTRWVLEQHKFPFASLYNADIRGGHLRDRFDAIIIPDMAERSILEGHRAGTIPERYAGGIGEEGAQELRDFVNAGGTLIAFNNASIFAINQLQLPVENALAGVAPAQFLCSGCLVSVHVEDAKNPLTAGLAADTAVMFERGPAFNTKAGFKGSVLARYPRDRSPLMSGYLVGADRLQGRVAALSAEVGKGRVVLLGFRPQWRGQSHAAYKFFFNALYLRE
jgi:hypothetical protein